MNPLFDIIIRNNKLWLSPTDDKTPAMDLTPYIDGLLDNVTVSLSGARNQYLYECDGVYRQVDDCQPAVRVSFSVDTVTGNLSGQSKDDMEAAYAYVKATKATTALLQDGLTIIRPTARKDCIHLSGYIERGETSISLNMAELESNSGTVYIPDKHLFKVTAVFRPESLTIDNLPITHERIES